jgi:hypothetical protein
VRRWLLFFGCAGLVLSASACGGDDKSASPTTTVRVPATTGAGASGQSTTTGSATGQSTTTGSASGTTPCALVPIEEVIAATKVAANAGSTQAGQTTCIYVGPLGTFFRLDRETLTKADQATFDAKVKGQESGVSLTSLSGIGDGNGSLAKHADNVKVYARKGTTLLAITLYNTAADPTNNAQELLRKAISRV